MYNLDVIISIVVCANSSSIDDKNVTVLSFIDDEYLYLQLGVISKNLFSSTAFPKPTHLFGIPRTIPLLRKNKIEQIYGKDEYSVH